MLMRMAVCVGLVAVMAGAQAEKFVDPINQPAVQSVLAKHAPVYALARAGERLIAAGVRGHILVSDDAGKTWRQSMVPVSVDLVGLSFPLAEQGWAVGHGGVVLHSADGGMTWQRQLAGLESARAAEAYYTAATSTPAAASALEQEKQLLSVPRGQPFLDVYFENSEVGFVVGTFNRIFKTEDGGKTWLPWMDRVDNPEQLNFSSIRGRGDRVFLTGEKGKVWKLDRTLQRFVGVSTPYNGTLFGLQIGDENSVLAFGMRGALYRSGDDGAHWERLPVDGSVAGITSSVELPDHRIVLVDQAGEIRLGDHQSKTFLKVKLPRSMPLYAVTATGKTQVVLGGALGLLSQDLP